MIETKQSNRSATKPTVSRQTEHRFYLIYLIVIALLIIWGFSPSFFLRDIVPSESTLQPLRFESILHGIFATAFTLFLPLQACLVTAGKQKLHIKIGSWGFILGAMLIPMGYIMAFTAHNRLLLVTPFAAPIIASIALSSIPTLGVLLWVGWRKRFDAQTHKRIMVLIACVIADPGISRLSTPIPDMILLVATLFPLIIWDLYTRRRLHWATVLGSGLYIFELTWRIPVGLTDTWRSFIALLPGFGV